MEITIVDLLFISALSISTLLWYKLIQTKNRLDAGYYDEIFK